MRKSFLLLLTLLTMGFTVNNPPDKKAIRCFRFTLSMTMIDGQGKSMGTYTPIDDKLFVCGDLVMVGTMAEGMEHYPPDDDRYFKWNSYLVFEKDSAWGIRYETRYPDSSRRDRVGWPIVRIRMNDDLPKNVLGPHPHLVASTRDGNTGTATETYTRIGDSAQSDEDTCILVFNRQLKTLPWFVALSTVMDSTYDSKFVELRCKLRRSYSSQLKAMVDGRTFHYKMEEQAFFNRDSALLYFNRYLRESQPGP